MSINMSFPTTFQVDAGVVSHGHPSMFQTSSIDLALSSDLSKISVTDPANIWLNRVSLKSSQYPTPTYDPNDPPFSDMERDTFVKKLESVMDKTLNNVQPTLLFHLFFSKYNFQIIQNNIRFTVNKWTGHHIGEQSSTELILIMESIFSSHARNIDERNTPSKVMLKYIRNEVGRLNELVINETVPIIVNGLEQHRAYLKKVDNPISAGGLQRPLDTKVTGTKIFRSSSDIFSMY